MGMSLTMYVIVKSRSRVQYAMSLVKRRLPNCLSEQGFPQYSYWGESSSRLMRGVSSFQHVLRGKQASLQRINLGIPEAPQG